MAHKREISYSSDMYSTMQQHSRQNQLALHGNVAGKPGARVRTAMRIHMCAPL